MCSLLIKSLTAAVQPSENETESPEIYKVITEEKFPANRETNSEGKCTNVLNAKQANLSDVIKSMWLQYNLDVCGVIEGLLMYVLGVSFLSGMYPAIQMYKMCCICTDVY